MKKVLSPSLKPHKTAQQAQGKQKLISDLEAHISLDNLEKKHKEDILQFLRESENNFDRSNLKGHITGSSWLLNKDKTKVLLNHHRKLNRWMNFGGHADGETDILAVAIKETQEESGFTDVFPVQEAIFDVDVHTIPDKATKGEPEHLHYDIRYLLWTPEEDFSVTHESINLKWVDIDEAAKILKADSLVRMIEKWRKIKNGQ